MTMPERPGETDPERPPEPGQPKGKSGTLILVGVFVLLIIVLGVITFIAQQ